MRISELQSHEIHRGGNRLPAVLGASSFTEDPSAQTGLAQEQGLSFYAQVKRAARRLVYHISVYRSLRTVKHWYAGAGDATGEDQRRSNTRWSVGDWAQSGLPMVGRLGSLIRPQIMAFPITIITLMFFWFAFAYSPVERMVQVPLYPDYKVTAGEAN